MNAFETITTVGGQGEIVVPGVPFQPGTEVAVVISPKARGEALAAAEKARLNALLAALDHARNVEPIGPLRRDELYDRNDVH